MFGLNGRLLAALLFFAVSAVGLGGTTIWAFAGKSKVASELKTVTAERNTLANWVESVCSSVQAPTRPSGARDVSACRQLIDGLVRFKSEAATKTNDALVQHLQDQLVKSKRDTVAAQRDAARSRRALQTLSEASENVPESNEVGADYWRALNGAAGLQPPDARPHRADPAPGGGGDDQGDPAL